ncbi:helix-turn-helix domain-containing protein [Paenibacillus terrae]|uniref:DNA-binding protein n=1 Tax=Paenibacillus terrae TaxID=159743 RepID=A0A0D7X643_9BACL|nr:helix-turn-helix transcriptional regulator [Paenibacillus terrae]KJD46699.1 DNA-binding protein [Paenibacillus terrae]
MKITPTIRAEFEKYLRKNGLSKTEFGHIAGLNPGTVSGIVTGNKSISVHQLDRITGGMGLEPDHFYERYIEECIMEEPLNWKRIRPFLYRCVQFNRLDCLQRVVGMLLDNPGYLPHLFVIAEDAFKKGYNEAAAYLYENIAEGEKYQHSDRLAICHYRIFTIQIGDDQNRNLKAATRFESFVERLNEVVQLDALKDLANVYRSLREWDKVDEIAKALEIKAEIQYKLDQHHDAKKENLKKPASPPFAYWAFSHLLHAEVCEAHKDYEKALQHTYTYADLSWVKETDEITLEWKKRYKEWAEANTYVNKLHAGEVSILADYVAFFSSKKEETLPGLDNVVEAANRHHLNIDHILKQFETEIFALLDKPESVGVYNQQFITERYVHFTCALAVYYFNKGDFADGFTFSLSCLEKSSLINNKPYIIKCVKLYESYKQYASSETKAAYRNLINEVDEDET